MKTLITLFSKVFKTQKQNTKVEVEMTDAELDAWIISIRQEPQYTTWKVEVDMREYTTPKNNQNDGLEEAGCLVLA